MIRISTRIAIAFALTLGVAPLASAQTTQAVAQEKPKPTLDIIWPKANSVITLGGESENRLVSSSEATSNSLRQGNVG